VVPGCLVRYRSTSPNGCFWGVTGWFRVDCGWKNNGGIGVTMLVGGESKLGPIEDKGIGGSPVDDG
jgi:hypothetical protein